MPSDYDDELVKTAVFHIKAKEYDLARRYLERALDVVDDEDTRAKASWWLSEITTDPVEKRNLLETVLAWDRNNAQARRALMILDGKLKPEEIVDADNLPVQESGQVLASNADRFTCPNCGARMVFAPDGHSLYCEHCSRNETLADQFDGDEPVERDFLLAMATAQGHRKPVAMHSFQCRGCGAAFLLAPEVISATCSYCGSPHVISIDETRELIEPDGVIPFAFDQKNAGRCLVNWAKKKKVKPDGKVDMPKGIYLPVWSFDLGGEIPYTAQIAVSEGRGSRKVVIQTISDTHPVYSANVPVAATRKLGRLLDDALAGFSMAEAVPYDPRFLSDWPAEVYEISMSDASLDARKKVYERTRHELEILLDTQGSIENFRPSSSNMSVESFKLILVPAWLTSYAVEGKVYNVLVNGQTGAVTGETPSLDLLGWVENILK
jgi:Zn finger protein HypA/HybF involved in hydrogenase expression